MPSKVFDKSGISYRYEAPYSHFSPQGEHYDRPIGQVREMARRFRLLCFTFLGIALGLLVECVVELHKKVPDLTVAEQVGTGYIERVVLLPYDEKRYLEICPTELSGEKCVVKHGQ